MIDSLVAGLLAVTIGYCMILNNRLKRLKADEAALKATIVELVNATAIAERAVDGLKATARENEQTLGERLGIAERLCVDLTRQVRAGEIILGRLARIVAAARMSPETDPALSGSDKSDPKMLAAAARAFAERTRERVGAMAA
jgi:hypothetical protein